MFSKIAEAFKRAFNNKEIASVGLKVPEVLGLRIGGALEIDPLILKLIESDLTIENAASTQLICSVGVVDLGDNVRLVRYYTDDEGYLQVLQENESDDGVKEVSLWYFYETSPIDAQTQWDALIKSGIVTPNGQYDLDGTQFSRLWDNTKPVAVTEKTYHKNGTITETDQFMMVYTRQVSDNRTEELLIAGEEKIVGNNLDRLMVKSTGIQLNQTDFKVVA
ncbi:MULTISPECIES: YjfK family protein [Photorhabdus]|uniref:YjfK family protein n=1 Tax=Photorhabdus TaxID=29487 RepID=UPI0009005E51|nr:YjfK family protein [Photorhabdus thracensis]MCC8422458.1 YjfK family protein [Photorhabdus thracensis]